MRTILPFLLLLLFTFGCERKTSQAPPSSTQYRPFIRKSRQGKKPSASPTNSNSKVQSPGIDRYNLSMNENEFWNIIDLSVLEASDERSQVDHIRNQLIALGASAVVKFELRMQLLLYNSYTSNLLCAGELLHRHCPRFQFEEFRCWIILQGKAVYYLSLKNPDSLEVEYKINRHCFESERLYDMPKEIFENIYQEDLFDQFDKAKFPFYEDEYPPLRFRWRPNRPTSMRKTCPNLYDACY